MSDDNTIGQGCVVCGKATEGEHGVTYLYHAGRRFALCCPMCGQMFQRAPERFARGENVKTLVEELLDEMKWKETGH